MGVASLVLGILAVLIGIFSSGVLGWLGAIMAIIGVHPVLIYLCPGQ